MSIYQFSNYREFLKQELANRINENPKYSLRALAKKFEMAPSTLSEVLSGHTNLSSSSARRIAGKLNLRAKESSYFLELVVLETTKDPEAKSLILERMRIIHPKRRETQDLSIEHFKQMSEWYHSVILELPNVLNFEFNVANVARAVGVSKPQAELAIGRLLKLGLLKENDGRIVRINNDYRLESKVKSAAMRKYYGQMLSKIAESLEVQTPQERLSGYLNLAIDDRALPQIDQAIDRLFVEIKNIASQYSEPTTVYHLSLHFMNLLKTEKSL